MPKSARGLPAITVVGGGNMASALLGGLLSSGWTPALLHVVENDTIQARRVHDTFDVCVAPGLTEAAGSRDVVIWALKPQVLRHQVPLTRSLFSQSVHISIAAGVAMPALLDWSGSKEVVRAMPNTAVSSRKGVTGLLASPGLSDRAMAWTERIFSSTGYCFWVNSDEEMDAVTAVTGSGPAYVFHMLEAYQAAAEAQGFDSQRARLLTLKTAEGALTQAMTTDSSLAELRARVTSKGGTTEAALQVFDRFRLVEGFESAVRAAHERAGEISRETVA